MMHATEDVEATRGESPEVDELAPLKPQSSPARGNNANDNNSNDEEEVDELTSQAPRPRRQSDAELRDELEKQREISRNSKMRSSIANNRFLAKKQSAKAPRDPEEDADADVDPVSHAQEQAGPDSDEEEATATGRTLAKKKKSIVETSSDQAVGSNHSAAITHPAVHLFPGFAMNDSKWTKELTEEEDCGFFIQEKRNQLTKIHPSTLIRLEERLRREHRHSSSNADSENRSAFPLTDLIHGRNSHFSDPAHDVPDGAFVSAFDGCETPRAARAASPPPPRGGGRSVDVSQTAMLEIHIDRIVLDDHISFTLEDRLGAQLRSLYTAYGQLQQRQPWKLPLDRIETYIDKYCGNLQIKEEQSGNPSSKESMTKWEQQTARDAEQALNELAKLQQLHQQIVVKWNELQDCCRRGETSSPLHQVKIIQRGDAIDLANVHAFVDILAERAVRSNAGNCGSQSEGALGANVDHFAKRLEALEVQDKCLSQVLQLESRGDGSQATGAHANTMSSSTFQATHWSCSHRRLSKFYVAIYINGKQACSTKAWNSNQKHHSRRYPRGVILFDETFRLKLPYFPESVSATVFEQGYVFDTAISTTSLPVILPGEDILVATAMNSRPHSASDARIPVASLAPSSEWYQFSSTTPIPRTKWHSSFLNSALYMNFIRHPHGRIHLTTSWVPFCVSRTPWRASCSVSEFDSSQLGADVSCYLPPKRPPITRALLHSDKAKVIGSRYAHSSARHAREELNKSSFSYERDFLVHMQSLDSVLDPNDPENVSAMRLQRHVKSKSEQLAQRDVFRANCLSFGHSEGLVTNQFVSSKPLTKRNLLLQLRDREHAAKYGTSICEATACRGDAIPNRGGVEVTRWQHAVFEDPMPLEEAEITANEKYLALLRPEVKDFDHRLRAENAEEGDLHSLERQHKTNLLKIHDFIDRVKQNQLVAKRKVVAKEKTKTLASIIQEQPLPLFPGTLDLSGLGQLFARRRRLRPQAEKRAAPSALAEWPKCCDLYIQVQKAINVPVRMKQQPRDTGREEKIKRRERQGKRKSDKERPFEAGDDDDDEAGATISDVRSLRKPSSAPEHESQIFVEMSFQGKKRKTSCSLVSSSSGSNPVWMETLVVPFRPPLDDWSPGSIQRCQDEIRINLFDQVVVPREDDEDRGGGSGDRNSTGAQLRSFHQENYFLGGLHIPFTTLYFNSCCLEATLRCDMPIEHFGYTNLKSMDDGDGSIGIGTPRSSTDDETPRQEPRSPMMADAMGEKDEDGVKKTSREATFITLMMTLDPLLPQPVKPFDDATVSCGSSVEATDANKRLVQYAKEWTIKTQNTNAATKQRHFHVFVHNLSSGNTFLSQYLCAQQPPRNGVFSKSPLTLQKLVRFVNLIPFLDDWHLFDGEKDIWSTSQEFLGINAGDYEEHAVLLCNYFQWLDRDEPNYRNYLVIGHAVPEGEGVYVLRQDAYKIPQRSVLWNASTGTGYHVWDEKCPMRDVSLIVSSENIYANVQHVPRFRDLNWDIESNPKAWKPFFHTATIQKDKFALPCVQLRDLTYEETPAEYVRSVEMEIRETLKLEIRRWRSSRFTTTFNIDASMKLGRHLEELETHMQGQQLGERTNQPNARSAGNANVLQDLQQTKEISGMPLNITFTDLNKVIDMVKNTASGSRRLVSFLLFPSPRVCFAGIVDLTLLAFVTVAS